MYSSSQHQLHEAPPDVPGMLEPPSGTQKGQRELGLGSMDKPRMLGIADTPSSKGNQGSRTPETKGDTETLKLRLGSLRCLRLLIGAEPRTSSGRTVRAATPGAGLSARKIFRGLILATAKAKDTFYTVVVQSATAHF